jgi:hypothetical protein
MWPFERKKNTLFNAARQKVTSLSTFIEKGEQKVSLEKNKWMPIVEHDPKSPMIMGMGENSHLIYYPPFSTPYLHQYESSIKYVEVLSGVLWDKISGEKYKTGDQKKVYPGEEIQPFTTHEESYVRVCVTQIDDIWERICK